MILNFIFSNLNLIVLSIWILFLIIITIRFFRPIWLKNISYNKLIFIAIGLHIFYGVFVSWGQYYVWSTLSDVTRVFVNSPLGPSVPFPFYLEWARPLFSGQLGYFFYYIIGRFWLNIILTFIISGVLYLIFKVWKSYKGGFGDQGPELLFVLMLISGLPGIFVTISFGFVLSILRLIYFLLKGNKEVKIESVFIFTTLFALLFANIILSYVL